MPATFPFALIGPDGAFNAALRDFRKWKGGLPSSESAFFEVSPDVHAEYRRLIVLRCGGTDEFHRLRKKTPKGEWRGLKYSAYQVRPVEDLDPGIVNFIVEKWEQPVNLRIAQVPNNED